MGLEEYRQEIDRINREIVDSIAERMKVVEEIGEYKRENGLDVRDEGREEVVKDQFADLFEERDLPSERGRELAENLIEMAVERERDD